MGCLFTSSLLWFQIYFKAFLEDVVCGGVMRSFRVSQCGRRKGQYQLVSPPGDF